MIFELDLEKGAGQTGETGVEIIPLTETTTYPEAKEWGGKGISVWLELGREREGRGKAIGLDAKITSLGVGSEYTGPE